MPQRLEQYLALGDSFASGEGTFNYIAGTEDGPNQCHQSIFSYPYLMQSNVGETASVACSGAKISNIRNIGDNDVNQLDGINDADINSAAKGESALNAPSWRNSTK